MQADAQATAMSAARALQQRAEPGNSRGETRWNVFGAVGTARQIGRMC
jgi:hypothetical protein